MALIYKSEEDPQIAPLFTIIYEGEMELEEIVVRALDKELGDILSYDENDTYKTMYDLMDQTEQMIESSYLAGGITRTKMYIQSLHRSLDSAVSKGSCINDDNYHIGKWYYDMVTRMKDLLDGKMEPPILQVDA